MSRFHVHVSVDDLQRSIEFYSALFGNNPTVVKEDYAKWMLDDPRINLAISTRGDKMGLDHVGIQAESEQELKEIEARIEGADLGGQAQTGTMCCYSRSNKYWTVDPQGIAWEAFHTLDSAPVFSEATDEVASDKNTACCVPNNLSNCC